MKRSNNILLEYSIMFLRSNLVKLNFRILVVESVNLIVLRPSYSNIVQNLRFV